LKFTNVFEVLTASIIKAVITLMMEAVSTSETLAGVCQTPCPNIPEDSHIILAALRTWIGVLQQSLS